MIVRCVCGHSAAEHVASRSVCLAKGCFCWIYRQQPTGQGRHAPAGGEALPIQGRNESTP